MAFVGRLLELQSLKDKLHIYNQVLLAGPSGSGKTSLVKKYLQSLNVKSTHVCWLNFGLPVWPYLLEHQKNIQFEDYFSELFSDRLFKYQYIICDQFHKLATAQQSFLSSFAEQILDPIKFIFVASELVDYLDHQVITLGEMTALEAEEVFKINFPQLDTRHFAETFLQGLLPQEVLLLPQSGQTQGRIDISGFGEESLKILKYLALIDRPFSIDELNQIFKNQNNLEIINNLNKKFLIHRAEVTDSNEYISATLQLKKFLLKILSKEEKDEIYKLHIHHVYSGEIHEPELFKYLIFLNLKTEVLAFCDQLQTSELNHFSIQNLKILAEFLEPLDLKIQHRQILIQSLLLSGQRFKAISLAKIWLQEWPYQEHLTDSEQSYLYELIHLLTRSDLYSVAERALNFYLNRVNAKLKPLFKLEVFRKSFETHPQSAEQGFERLLAEVPPDDKLTLAHVYFQLARVSDLLGKNNKTRSYYEFAEKYYLDNGLTYYASISCLNRCWTYLTERNFLKLEEEFEQFEKRYLKFGFLLTRFGYELLRTHQSFFSGDSQGIDRHLGMCMNLMKHGVANKPKIDFYQLVCLIANFRFDFQLAEETFKKLTDLFNNKDSLRQSAILFGRPQNVEQLLDARDENRIENDQILFQLLLLQLISLDSLTDTELKNLEKSKIGNAIISFLREESEINRNNLPQLISQMNLMKSHFDLDKIELDPQFDLWTGQIFLKKILKKESAQEIIKTYIGKEDAEPEAVDIIFNDRTREITYHGKINHSLEGKATLYKLLKVLLTRAPVAIGKESLALSVWGEEYDPMVHDNRIYISIQRLREIFGDKFIVQIDNGYALNPKVSFSLKLSGANESSMINTRAHQILEIFRSAKQSGKSWLQKKDLLLGSTLSEATIKRIIQELLKENLIVKEGQGIHTKYRLK